MILRSITPRLETYIGREPPRRLTERPYNELSPAMSAHPWVAYRREGETYSVEPAGRDGPVYIDVWARGAKRFSHWLFDLWPKIVLARRAGLDLSRIIVTENPARYVDETLESVGLSRAALVPATKGVLALDAATVLRVGDLRAGMWTPPWILDAVRSRFLPAKAASEGRRLYVSRNRAERRRTINEDEVLALIEPLGFETIYLEEMTLREAAALFSQAEAVLAPHGAGLANIVFCRPDCRVVEYFSWHISQEYWLLAHALGLSYACIEGEGADGRRHFELTPAERKDRNVYSPEDIRVSISDLRRVL